MPDEPLEIPSEGYARGKWNFEPNSVAGTYIPPGAHDLTAHFVVDAITMLCRKHGVELRPDWTADSRSAYLVAKMLHLFLIQEDRHFEQTMPVVKLPEADYRLNVLGVSATIGLNFSIGEPPDEDDAPGPPRDPDFE